jgi:hypothetical protein
VAGFWPFISGTGDEDLDELGDLITQMEEANKGYKTPAHRFSEDGPLEEVDEHEWRTGSELPSEGEGGPKGERRNGASEQLGVSRNGFSNELFVEKFGRSSSEKLARKFDPEGLKGRRKSEREGTVSSAGIFGGRKASQSAERVAETNGILTAVKQAEEGSSVPLESIDLETNDRGVVSGMKIRGKARNADPEEGRNGQDPNGRALSGVKKPRTRNEAHGRNYWVSRHMLQNNLEGDDIREHVTYDDVGARKVGAERHLTGLKSESMGQENVSRGSPADVVMRKPDAEVAERLRMPDVGERLKRAETGKQLGAADSNGLEDVLVELQRAVASIGNSFGFAESESEPSNAAQSAPNLTENDDLFSKGRTALDENGGTILAVPMEVSFEEGLGGLELALPSDVAAASDKMPPRALHDVVPRVRNIKHVKMRDAASVISSRRPVDAIVDVYSVFEEGSGGLHLLRPEETGPLTGLEERTDSGERDNKELPVQSTEGVFTVEESVRIESVGSTDEAVTLEDKITEPDHGVAKTTLSEKEGASGGGKEGTETEKESTVEARFAKARAVRNAREKGIGGNA